MVPSVCRKGPHHLLEPTEGPPVRLKLCKGFPVVTFSLLSHTVKESISSELTEGKGRRRNTGFFSSEIPEDSDFFAVSVVIALDNLENDRSCILWEKGVIHAFTKKIRADQCVCGGG